MIGNYNKIYEGECVQRRQGDQANYRHIKDMMEIFQNCDNENLSLPTYVIILPTEVLVIPAVAYSSFASKLVNIDSELKQTHEKISSYDLKFLPLRSPGPQSLNHDLTTVVIAKVPSELNNPAKRCEIIDSIPGHECIHSIKPSGDKLGVRIDKIAARNFCNVVPSVMRDCDVKVKETKYIGIIKGIPTSFDEGLLIDSDNITHAKRIGSSLAVRVFFENAVELANALRLGIKIGYEIYRVYEFQRPPKCCYNCQSPNHLKSNCDKEKCCSRCAGQH